MKGREGEREGGCDYCEGKRVLVGRSKVRK